MIKLIKAVFKRTPFGVPLLGCLSVAVYLTALGFNGVDTTGVALHHVVFAVVAMVTVLMALFMAWVYPAILVIVALYGLFLKALSDRSFDDRDRWIDFISGDDYDF